MKKSRTCTQREKVVIIYCSAVLSERRKSLPAVCKMPVSCRRSKVVVSFECWRKGWRRSCLLLSQGCHLCQLMAPRWPAQLLRTCHNHPGMPALLCCHLIPIASGAPNPAGVWALAASKTVLNYQF